ncbi:Glucosamine-6-phosphate deaminase [Paenibacillus sp. CECT 9249]|nr:Glucosamine-6-phosphate deaminase [Paenibacillus sp. CECT 9249]
MSSILHAIRKQLDHLHQQERKLADYILQFPGHVVTMGITDLAEQSGTSAATVTRFCKSLYFRGFPDFKTKLAADMAQHASSQSYQDIIAGNSLAGTVSAIEANHLLSISDTTRLLDLTELERALKALNKAGRIDLYGVATSGIVAQDFYYKLVLIGKHACAYTDSHMQITSASNLTPNDVAIAISYSGETLETIDALKCAKANGATTISLTKYGSNTLSDLADIKLFTSSLEEGMRRGDMASRIAQLHVIDIIFSALVSEQFTDLIPKLERSYRMVEKYRKEKGGNVSDMNILTFETNEELNEVGAGIIASLVQTKPNAVLGLATGSTPIGIYEELIKLYQKGRVSFKHATTFNLDEYIGLPEDHPESYRTFMNEKLFNHIDIPLEQTHVPNGNAADLEKECRDYDDMLTNSKQIDLQILGLGHNGHIGFNEPDQSLNSGTHIVQLKEETRKANARFFNSIDEVPTQAITMGVGTILKAKMIILVVRGAEKAAIVQRALQGAITTDVPASLLQTHPNVVVLLDKEAGGMLS